MSTISNWTLMLLKPDIVSHPHLLKPEVRRLRGRRAVMLINCDYLGQTDFPWIDLKDGVLINDILTAGIEVGGTNLLRLTPERAAKLYGVHEGKFFYPRLVRHVCSGPVIAMRVRGDVRAALGSSKLWPLPVDGLLNGNVVEPSIRQRFSLSDVRNVAHTSDAEVAADEIAIFEPFDNSNTLLDTILMEQGCSL